MESIIEIEEIRMERLEDKTKAWGSQEEEEDEKTRCWGPCPPPAPISEELEELEIT